MKNMSGEEGRVRLILEVSHELNETLEHLASRARVSKSEILRKAIALIEVALEAKDKKQTIGINDQDGKLVTRIIGL